MQGLEKKLPLSSFDQPVLLWKDKNSLNKSIPLKIIRNFQRIITLFDIIPNKEENKGSSQYSASDSHCFLLKEKNNKFKYKDE